MPVPSRSRKGDTNREKAAAIGKRLGDRSIVLIGLMGAGKTSIGRRLANRLGLAFTDADVEIEAAAGKSISEIFSDHGEAYFRNGEKRVIARLLMSGPQVLATGGGAYMSQETRANIRKHGIAVWLKGDLALLLERVNRRDHRPLLKSGDPETIMRKLMEERYPVYEKADIIVESRDVPHDVIVGEIIAALANNSAMSGAGATPCRPDAEPGS